MPFETTNYSDKQLGYAQVVAGGADTAIALTSVFPGGVVPAGTARLVFKPSAQGIRFRDDGTNPTAAVGYPLAVGVEFSYSGRGMDNLKVIASTAGASIDVLAYGG